MIRHLLKLAGGAVVTVLFAATPAQAASITFDQSTYAGSFTYDASTGIASGSGILFQTITVAGAPNGDTNYVCSGCFLSFTTSAATTNAVAGGNGIAIFGNAGGTATMTGQVYRTAANGGTLVSSTSTILSGSFASSFFNQLTLGGGDGVLNIRGTDSKDAGFVGALGLGNPFGFLGSVYSLTACSTSGTVTNCSVTNADLTNTSTNAPVPEPASMLLLGSGLVGLAAAYRRQQRRRRA